VEAPERVVRVPRLAATRRHDEILGARRVPGHALEPAQLPRRKEPRERRVHGHLARVVGLGLLTRRALLE